MSYVSYHSSKTGFAVLSLKDSVGAVRAVLGLNGKQIDFARMDAKDFNAKFLKAELNGRLMDPKEAVTRLLSVSKLPQITKPALERIEQMFETKGKSTEQIRAEIVRLAEELPQEHALRDVPKSFPDRGQAIAAYTSMRQAISKEKAMEVATTTDEVAKRGRKAKAAVNGEAKAAKAEAPAPKARKAKAERPAKAKKAAPRGEDTGTYRLTGKALEVKDPTELGMQSAETSARSQVLAIALSSKKKTFTLDDFKKIKAGPDAVKGAVKALLRYPYLVAV